MCVIMQLDQKRGTHTHNIKVCRAKSVNQMTDPHVTTYISSGSGSPLDGNAVHTLYVR
jgi:hypothetical protein